MLFALVGGKLDAMARGRNGAMVFVLGGGVGLILVLKIRRNGARAQWRNGFLFWGEWSVSLIP